jgi:hypothetical protein
MAKEYKTLENEVYDIDSLGSEEREVFSKAVEYFNENPDWNVFANYWFNLVTNVSRDMSREEVVQSPLYRICQDMEARLGIKQGRTK